MDNKPGTSNDDILKRFKRIEGQIKGIQRMIEDEKRCFEILTQVAAVRAAVDKAGSLILEKYSMNCIENAVSSEDRKKAVEDISTAIRTFIRFSEHG